MAGKTVVVKFLGEAEQLKGTLKTVQEDSQKANDKLGGMASGAAKMAAGFAAVTVVTDLGKQIIDTFDEMNRAEANIKTVMQDMGEKVTPKFTESLTAAQEKATGLGFSAADATNGIAELVRGGLSVNDAFKYQPQIMDLAAAKHLTLADASRMTMLAIQGNSRALKDLNIALPPALATTQKLVTAQDAATKAHLAAGVAFQKYSDVAKKYGEGSKQTLAAEAAYKTALDKASQADAHAAQVKADLGDRTKNLSAVMDIYSSKLGGSAKSASETLTGRLQVMKAEVVDAGAKVLGGLTPALGGAVNVLGMLTSHLNIVLPIIGVFTVAMVAHKAIQIGSSVATSVHTAALGAQKLALGVATAAQWLFNAAMDANPIMLIVIAIAAVVAAFVVFGGHIKQVGDIFGAVFGAIKAVIGGIGDFFKTAFTVVAGVFDTFGKIIGAVPNAIKTAFSVVEEIITAPFRQAFDMVSWLWNHTLGAIHFTLPSWIPIIGGKGFGFPQMPTLHSGGIVPGFPGQAVPILAQAGEQVISAADVRKGGGAGNAYHVEVNVTSQADPYAISSAMLWGLRTQARKLAPA